MVILGGLEFVVGGYLVHRHYKNKNEKARIEKERIQQQQNTYPGASRPSYPQQHQHQHRPTIPPQKYASYGSQPPPQHRPHPYPAQTFPQARPCQRPPQNVAQPPPQMQPLTRIDSFATISHMPIANGSMPHDAMPPLPPRHQQRPQPRPNLQQRPSNHPYNNAAFSASTPAFGQMQGVPHNHTGQGLGGNGNAVDDNSHMYGPPPVHYAESTQLGDVDDPPPPYRP